MFRNFHEDLKSIWFFVDVSEGFIVIFMGFVLVLREFLHPSVPLPFDVVESSVYVSLHFSLFAGKMFLLSLSFVLGDFSTGRRCGGRCEGGDGFLGFESSLVWDSNGEGWW